MGLLLTFVLFSMSHLCRDLKPENILLDQLRNVKVADFGLANLMCSSRILDTSCGSPHYASPEIILGRPYDGKCTDVWSMGVIFFVLFSGTLPFDHSNIPTLLTLVTKGRFSMPSWIPDDVANLISLMLTVDPALRITLPDVRRILLAMVSPNIPDSTLCALRPIPIFNLSSHCSRLASTSPSTDWLKVIHLPTHADPTLEPTPMIHSATSTKGLPDSVQLPSTVSNHDDVKLPEFDEALLIDLENLGFCQSGARISKRASGERDVSDVGGRLSGKQEQLVYQRLSECKTARLSELSSISREGLASQCVIRNSM